MKILAISPHTDDAEVAAGATLSGWVQDDHDVHILALSLGGANKCEYYTSANKLGIKQSQVRLCNYVTRTFPKHRQKILQMFVDLNREIQPDIVLCPASFDVHQDHKTVHQEVVRAFRNTALYILGYDMPWNMTTPALLHMFNEIGIHDLELKVQAIECYESQSNRQAMSRTTIKALASVRGNQAGFLLAEAFEVIRIRRCIP